MVNSGLNVGQLMHKLRQQDPNEEVKYSFVHMRPTTLESYRGYYEDAALGYSNDGQYIKVQSLLDHFERTLGKVFPGWKGGNGRPIDLDTTLWVANPGETGDTIILEVRKLTYVTLVLGHDELEMVVR